jgi:tRNA(adenine34) deaminase
VPVGSVVVDSETFAVIARARNRILETKDATAHSELLAIRTACEIRKSERILGTSLITTLEPCLMCTGALILARVDKVFYMSQSEKGFMMRSALASGESFLNHSVEIEQILEFQVRSTDLLKKFFKEKRNSDKLP